MQQRLGWDAAAVQAGATELVALDESNRLSKLSRAKCSGIAATSATENYDVKVVVSHEILPHKKQASVQNFTPVFCLDWLVGAHFFSQCNQRSEHGTGWPLWRVTVCGTFVVGWSSDV